MKIFGRKKGRSERLSQKPSESGSQQEFYGRQSEEAPLTDPGGGYGQQARRSSKHGAGRRRETSNRASTHQLFMLFFLAGLIFGLILVGYLGIRFLVGLRVGPSEKDLARWEQSEAIRQKGAGGQVDLESVFGGMTNAVNVNSELIRERMRKWEQTERHMRAAEALNRRGINDDAIRRLTQALRLTPDHQLAQRLLLDIYMQSGEYTGAIPLCIRLLDQDSQQWDIKLDLLEALQSSREIETSLTLAEKMLLMQPNDVKVLERAAYAQATLGDAEKALALYDRILLNDSTHVIAMEGAGFIHQQTSEWKQAIPYYMELVRLDPKLEYYHSLSRCYSHQKEGGKAVIFLGQAASLHGEGAVSDWVSEAAFDPIRETVEFRSFVDQIVGIETRKSIEEIRLRAIETEEEALPLGADVPDQQRLQLLKPGQ